MSDTKVMTIQCKKCKRKVFKYLKVGKGNLLKAYKSKIKADYFRVDNDKMMCQCGHVLAIDKGNYYKMSDNYKYD